MKDLLDKLAKSHVTIWFKSGDKLENVVIEAIVKNILIGNYCGKITLIEISHIAYVSTEKGVIEIIETILKNTKEENKDK